MVHLHTLPPKTKYRSQWQHTSEHLRAQGCYDWMAAQLDELGPRKILDIGCGSGNGMLALINRFQPTCLISLEENLDCIEATVEALIDAGQHPHVRQRLSYELDEANRYRLFCLDEPIELEPGLSIVQSDITRPDCRLIEALEQEAPFDAITVWLIGTDGQNLHSVGATPPIYRRHIQRRISELGDQLLRPGGWIQFLDRTAFPLTRDLEEELVEDHQELLESTRLRFLKCSNRSYEEAGDGGIPMARASGMIGPGSAMGLKSLISWLPHPPQQDVGEASPS